jgi:hypothetical protein
MLSISSKFRYQLLLNKVVSEFQSAGVVLIDQYSNEWESIIKSYRDNYEKTSMFDKHIRSELRLSFTDRINAYKGDKEKQFI